MGVDVGGLRELWETEDVMFVALVEEVVRRVSELRQEARDG